MASGQTMVVTAVEMAVEMAVVTAVVRATLAPSTQSAPQQTNRDRALFALTTTPQSNPGIHHVQWSVGSSLGGVCVDSVA